MLPPNFNELEQYKDFTPLEDPHVGPVVDSTTAWFSMN